MIFFPLKTARPSTRWCAASPQAPLLLAVDAHDYPQAFMLIDNGHMQALFVDRPAAAPASAPRWCATALRCIPG